MVEELDALCRKLSSVRVKHIGRLGDLRLCDILQEQFMGMVKQLKTDSGLELKQCLVLMDANEYIGSF